MKGFVINPQLMFLFRKKPRLLTEGSKTRRVRFDVQMVSEFRAKLRIAEDLIGKLGFNLRELQELPSSLETQVAPTAAQVSELFKRK